jgi:hypothetical protein
MPTEYLVNKVEPNDLWKHLPIKKDLLFFAYRWKCLPTIIKNRERTDANKSRQGTVIMA